MGKFFYDLCILQNREFFHMKDTVLTYLDCSSRPKTSCKQDGPLRAFLVPCDGIQLEIGLT